MSPVRCDGALSFERRRKVEDRIDILEKRIEMLEAMVKMMANNNTNKVNKPKYTNASLASKYVITVDSDEAIDAITYDIESYVSNVEDLMLDRHPNVCYVKFANNRRYEVIVITKDFLARWKQTHRYFYSVTYDQAIDELKKEGVI
jgi:hypothetical protein